MLFMNTLRLALNPDLKQTLEFLKSVEYPNLTYAEVAKVAIAREATRAKRIMRQLRYDDSGVSPKELLLQAEKSFELEDEGKEGIFWDESKLKPLALKDHV